MLGVESLMGKWHSEGWDDQLSIVGAIIGWTRDTDLMSGNNVVAAGVEKMGFNLSALMHPSIVDRAAESPILADLTSGTAQVSDLKEQVDAIRADIMKKAKWQASIHAARGNDKKMLALISKKHLLPARISLLLARTYRATTATSTRSFWSVGAVRGNDACDAVWHAGPAPGCGRSRGVTRVRAGRWSRTASSRWKAALSWRV
jgi:hypothetical protein